jgi:tRNA G18 (ribose-2'-O)-methylase SpoU
MFTQVRHQPSTALTRPREIVVVCAPFRSQVNLSTIARTAGCCGVPHLIACGNPKIDSTIARDSTEGMEIEKRRSLVPVLRNLRKDGYTVVGLEQTTNSVSIHKYTFDRRTALVLGNERLGLTNEELENVDICVEIPVWGLPHSYNVATAGAMALYEYCKQYPHG